MARENWDEREAQFQAAHAATGISLEEWCAEVGLNFNSARRHIKVRRIAQKTPTVTAQFAQNNTRNAQITQIEESASELVDDDRLTDQQALFVTEYLKDRNATAAAERAGFADVSYGRRLYTFPHVRAVIERQLQSIAARNLITADEVIGRMWAIATVDVNELVEYRRTCCRHCWGKNHDYQWTENEYNKARSEAETKTNRCQPSPVGSVFVPNARLTPNARNVKVLDSVMSIFMQPTRYHHRRAWPIRA
jgi:Phage terminase, small subunit